MSAEFVDTNILVYAHDRSAAAKHETAVELLERLFEDGSGMLSTQVLAEFYAVVTKKLKMKSEVAEASIDDLAGWMTHRPSHGDILKACALHRRYKVSWWDAMILNSAIETGCSILWSEDLTHGMKYGTLTVRNPFR